MCGIFCMHFQDENFCIKFYTKHIKHLLENRGPDSTQQMYQNSFYWSGTVLWHQGFKLTNQPIFRNQKVLLFNGDLYMNEIYENSDTEFLFDLISNSENEEEFLNVFQKISGPFSLICQFKENLYFARDSLGRNSLLIGKYHESIFLTSVLETHNDNEINAIELPPLGVYKINSSSCVDLFPYQELQHEYCFEQLEHLEAIVKINVRDKIINPQWLQLKKETIFNFSFDKIIDDDIQKNVFEILLHHSEVAAACDKFIKLLSQSIKYRIERTQSRCKSCIKSNDLNCLHANISILFSGGVDCSIISFLANNYIDKKKPIDLLNVAFEKATNKSDKIDFNVPDRITGLSTYNELKHLCPERKWNFVEINVTRLELQENREKLRNLIYPLENVLDESLGAALYFASRGKGTLFQTHNLYESNCRVILMGSGADELFGGYTRHRNAFKRSTSENDLLQKELDLDWIRLPSRNLARDDRVIGDNGVTVRTPYIEEFFVNFARSLSSLQRCYPKIEEGIGDKLLLRLCAYKLGLSKCCQFRKRALQFGSKIADSRQSAKDKSKLLQKD
ncbi:hypothetical protein PVAND_013104 [Polypedilum vanderplanki]|uniref:Glutamine amidotransferase type-2 domain-containing protein n=1 Tax=Polypedilum vanderplanki TaxID=319348 RepID=A0A9J6CNM4_POLVA|nr:hypothetical protein PVAND_013104 [Polypedilum vanderplanki]